MTFGHSSTPYRGWQLSLPGSYAECAAALDAEGLCAGVASSLANIGRRHGSDRPQLASALAPYVPREVWEQYIGSRQLWCSFSAIYFQIPLDFMYKNGLYVTKCIKLKGTMATNGTKSTALVRRTWSSADLAAPARAATSHACSRTTSEQPPIVIPENQLPTEAHDGKSTDH